MTIGELADFLAADPEILFNGNYRNRRHLIGYFVQLRCGEHWVRVSVSNVGSSDGGTFVEDLDAMTKEDLIAERPFVVSLTSIADALRKITLRGTDWNPYQNSVFVPGVWLEEKVENHWYMVSVSRIEGLEAVPPERIDEPTDEFLRRMRAFDHNVRPVTRRRKRA